MAFFVRVLYKPPSKERVFLGAGWGGARDVRGPYLIKPMGDIVIWNWALSEKIPSTVKLRVAASNRCVVDALFVWAISNSMCYQTLIKRNDESILIIPNILADHEYGYSVITIKTSSNKAAGSSGIDIVAIDELEVFREAIP